MVDNWPEGRDFPFGVHASHTWDELGAIFRVIDDYNIRTFVELGLFQGGLSSMMISRCRHVPGFYYLGVEKDSDVMVLSVLASSEEQSGADIIFDDVFELENIQWIKHYLSEHPVPALIYCDNGDKPRELKTYLPMVPAGTYLMVHDWGTEITQRDLDVLDERSYHRIFPEYFEGTRLLLLEAT